MKRASIPGSAAPTMSQKYHHAGQKQKRKFTSVFILPKQVVLELLQRQHDVHSGTFKNITQFGSMRQHRHHPGAGAVGAVAVYVERGGDSTQECGVLV
jgi:hypothetical protein